MSVIHASEIINNIWAIHPRVAHSYLPTVLQLLKGGTSSHSELKQIKEEAEKANAPQIATLVGSGADADSFNVRYAGDLQNAPEGSIAIISYSGVVRMKGGMSHKGTEETRRELQMAGNNPNIKAVLFKGHSGGGSVFGTESLSNDMRDFEKTFSKPLAAIVEDQACSAMYWIISGAPRIFGSGASCEVGCIGTMTTFLDYQDYLEKEGVKEVVVRASKSFNKNEEYYQAMQGNVEPLQKNILDPLNNAFLGSVKRNRRGKIDLTNKVKDDNGNEVAEVLSGKTYYGAENVKVGLIDQIGSTQDALKYLSKEAKKYKTVKQSSSSKNSKMTIKNYTKLNDAALSSEIANLEASVPLATEEGYEAHKTMLDLATAEKAKRTAEANNAILTAENAELREGDGTSDLEAQVETLTAERDTANETIATREATITDLEGQVTEANTERDTAKASLAEANTNLETANGELAAANTRVAAFETFIAGEYGQETVDAFVPDASGTIEQPEVVESKIVYKTARERVADADAEARSIIAGATKKTTKED